MSKVYNRNDIEIKARELLSPMKGMCPDNVWKELNYRLNEENSKSEKSWKNTLYSPKMLALAIACISVITVLLWKFIPGVNNNQPTKNTSNTSQEIVNTSNSINNKSDASIAINDSTLSKSNLADKVPLKKDATTILGSGNPTVQNPTVKQIVYNSGNHQMSRDTLSHKVGFPKHRDTLAKTSYKKPSRDSVISIAKEQ